MPDPFDAVLFDLFDTLCHLDETLYREGKRRCALRLRVDPERYFQAWLALQDRCQRGVVASVEERIRKACALLGRQVDPGTVAEVRRHEEEALLRCASLHPDALPALRLMRSVPELKLALVSNASSPALPLLKALGLLPFFDALIFSFEVGSVKPEPEIYLAACRSLGVTAGRCLFVGDGNGRELEGAMALGMTAVRIERPEVMEAFRKSPSRSWHHSVRDLRGIADLPRDRQSSAGTSVS
jgi:putative hydrolase of the HAD superfamily